MKRKRDMVFILNGECIPDNDPRAVRARADRQSRKRTADNSSRNEQASGRQFQEYERPRNNGTAPQAGSGAGQGVLDPLARTLGIEGKTITIPPILGVPGREIQMVHLLVAALVVLLAGWRGVLVIVLLYFFLQSNQNT